MNKYITRYYNNNIKTVEKLLHVKISDSSIILYSRVPNNRPLPIVNFSIFFHPEHLYFNPRPPPPPPPLYY